MYNKTYFTNDILSISSQKWHIISYYLVNSRLRLRLLASARDYCTGCPKNCTVNIRLSIQHKNNVEVSKRRKLNVDLLTMITLCPWGAAAAPRPSSTLNASVQSQLYVQIVAATLTANQSETLIRSTRHLIGSCQRSLQHVKLRRIQRPKWEERRRSLW